MAMKTLKMDSSSRVAFISGEDVRVDASEITSWEWCVILKDVVKSIKPQLKYLPGFEPLGTYATVDVHDAVLTINNEAKVVKLFEESKVVDFKTKCMFICEIERIVSTEQIELHAGFKCFRQIPKIVRIDSVFLTIKGQFIFWGAAYCPEVFPLEIGSSYNSACYSLHGSSFCLIAEDDVKSYVETYSFLPEKILKKICSEVNKYCIDTRERLENIEIVRNNVFKSVTRVKWLEENK